MKIEMKVMMQIVAPGPMNGLDRKLKDMTADQTPPKAFWEKRGPYIWCR
jgi:hypothetical protein